MSFIKKKRIVIAVAAILIIAVTAVVFWFLRVQEVNGGGSEKPTRKAPRKVTAVAANRTHPTRSKNENRRRARARPRVIEIDEMADFSPAEKQMALSMQEALDDDDFEAVLEATSKALASKNPKLRQSAVEALGWFGEKALVELTQYMADPDEDVAESAVNAWEMALSEIDSAKEKIDIVKMVLPTSASRDALNIIGGEYSAAANEYIDEVDDEDVAAARRVEVLQPIVDMMNGPRKENVDICKEIYEDITGHEWISFEEAALYVSDPENYEPPEDRENAETPTMEEQPQEAPERPVQEETMFDGSAPERAGTIALL